MKVASSANRLACASATTARTIPGDIFTGTEPPKSSTQILTRLICSSAVRSTACMASAGIDGRKGWSGALFIIACGGPPLGTPISCSTPNRSASNSPACAC